MAAGAVEARRAVVVVVVGVELGAGVDAADLPEDLVEVVREGREAIAEVLALAEEPPEGQVDHLGGGLGELE